MAPPPTSFADSPEALVVGLARTGDQQAFAELVRRRQSWLRNLMRRCCNDEALADDLAQQALLQAWKDIAKLRQPQKFAGWLRRLAMNVWYQHLRRNDTLEDAASNPDQLADEADHPNVEMDLDRALAHLAVAPRTCVVLSYHEGLSHGEIAELTAIPLGTVKSHIKRGTAQLRQLLSAYQATSMDDLP